MKQHKILAAFLLLFSLILSYFSARSFLSMREAEIYYPSESITKIKTLSDYFEDIKNTRGDTPVYL